MYFTKPTEEETKALCATLVRVHEICLHSDCHPDRCPFCIEVGCCPMDSYLYAYGISFRPDSWKVDHWRRECGS